MASFRSTSFKFSFMASLAGIFFALFVAGCGQNGDRQTNITTGTQDNFSSPIPAQLEKVRPGLRAQVIVDGGTPNAQTRSLDPDFRNDRFIGTIPDLPVGSHTFEIQYFIDNVLIATAPVITVNIQANADTPVPFDAGALVYPDTDNDGFTNLNEVEIFGSASDAWARPDLKPEVSVVVNPQTAILSPNGVQTFTAAIAQNANQGVTWSVEGGDANGTITPGGTYTAPELPGTYNLVATSQADPTKSAKTVVTVAKPGTLDTASFGTSGTGGNVSTTLGGSSSITALAVQPDGKIIAVGQSNRVTASNPAGALHFTLVRYMPNGTIDITFGSDTNGIVVTPIGNSNSSIARAVALQADGKIVVGGDSSGPAGNHFALARYDANGILDSTPSSFGAGGIVSTPIGSSSFLMDLAIQPDGKIIAVGQSAGSIALARYNPNGTLDTSGSNPFGSTLSPGTTSGFVTTLIGTTGFYRAVALQPDGKILVAGQSNLNGSHFTLARYTSSGTLDTTDFGPAPNNTGGIVTTAIGNSSFAFDLAIQPDGKIVVSGQSSGTLGFTLALARYDAKGSLDIISFGTSGTGGIVTTTIPMQQFSRQAVALQTDGKIIVSGPLALIRYNTNGTPDSTFNAGNLVTTTIGAPSGGILPNLAFQGDGKIVIGGQSTSHFALERFQTTAPPVLLRATLSGGEEVPEVLTLGMGSATFVINPGGTEISFTVATSDLNVSTVTATHIHFAAPDGSDPILFSLPSSGFVSPLSGKITSANLGPLASVLPGVKATFADTVNAIQNGQTYIHIHTTNHLGGEIRGQILVAPPTLSSLQAQIFTPRCSGCHVPAGPGAEETGLDLSTDKETTFNMLVNKPSTEDPTFKRVEPGNPDASYLIKKLEGNPPPKNTRMPLGGPFLSDDEIKKVRAWITAGAKND